MQEVKKEKTIESVYEIIRKSEYYGFMSTLPSDIKLTKEIVIGKLEEQVKSLNLMGCTEERFGRNPFNVLCRVVKEIPETIENYDDFLKGVMSVSSDGRRFDPQSWDRVFELIAECLGKHLNRYEGEEWLKKPHNIVMNKE